MQQDPPGMSPIHRVKRSFPCDPDLEEQHSETQFNWIVGSIFSGICVATFISMWAIWRFVS